MTPGRISRPVQSTTSPASPRPSPIAAIFPPRTPTLICAGPPGVCTVPFFRTRSKVWVIFISPFVRSTGTGWKSSRYRLLFAMSETTLIDRAVIRLSGEDVRPFLQGLVTQDVLTLKQGEARWAGVLAAQGKALFDFLLWGDGEDILIDCEEAQTEALIRRLSDRKSVV